MATLMWDQVGERAYETGVSHGVLYPQSKGTYPKGYPWNGLTSVSENPSGAEDNSYYADNMKYFTIKSAEEFGLTIGCYTYPDEWAECNGDADIIKGVTFGQQRRNTFGFSYRTKIGNDSDGGDFGYKIHLAYGCSAAPSEKEYSTVNDSPEPIEFSFEVSTTPVTTTVKDTNGNTMKPTSLVTIDSTRIEPDKLKTLEDILYGTEETEARLPMPDELASILSQG